MIQLAPIKNIVDWPTALQPGERVVITEKLQGASFSVRYSNQKIWVSSATPAGIAQAFEIVESYGLHEGLRDYPDIYFHGVAFPVNGELRAAFFAAEVDGRIVSYPEFLSYAGMGAGLHITPLLYVGPWEPSLAHKYANGPTTITGLQGNRAGCIIQPVAERQDASLGRVILAALAFVECQAAA